MAVLDYEAVGEMFCNLDFYMEQDHELVGLRRIAFGAPEGADSRGYRLPMAWTPGGLEPIVFMKRYEDYTGLDTLTLANSSQLDPWGNTIDLGLHMGTMIVNHSDKPLGGQEPTTGAVIVGGTYMNLLTLGGSGVLLSAGDAFILKEIVAVNPPADVLTLFCINDCHLDVIVLGTGVLG